MVSIFILSKIICPKTFWTYCVRCWLIFSLKKDNKNTRLQVLKCCTIRLTPGKLTFPKLNLAMFRSLHCIYWAHKLNMSIKFLYKYYRHFSWIQIHDKINASNRIYRLIVIFWTGVRKWHIIKRGAINLDFRYRCTKKLYVHVSYTHLSFTIYE